MGKLRDNLNLIFSNLLFGANFSIYVSLVRNWFDFRQLFLLQVGAAALFFIPFALLSPRTPRMRWADLKNILIVTVLIIYGWMYTMLWGATYTNPVDASILATLGPVFTLLIAVGMHREPFSWVRTLGVAAALCGAMRAVYYPAIRFAVSPMLYVGGACYGAFCAFPLLLAGGERIRWRKLRFEN